MKTVVFLRHGPYPRIYNQAYALKKTKKYKLIFLCRNFDEKNLEIFKKVFDMLCIGIPYAVFKFCRHPPTDKLLNPRLGHRAAVFLCQVLANRFSADQDVTASY